MPCLKGMAAGFLAAEMRCPCGQLVPAARTSQLAEGRRSRRCVTVSAQDNGFSSDQSSKALQYQLSRSSTPKSPAAASPAHDHTSTIYEQELTKRKNQAREFITPWLTSKAKLRSMDTLAALRDQTPGLSSEQQDTALKRLLGQSWQVAAAHPVTYDSDEEAGSIDHAESPSGYNGKQNGHRDKYGPALTWEDGTVLYTSDLLERSSYEDVLHS